MCVLSMRKKQKDLFKEIEEILDGYYEGTPKRGSKFDEGGE